MPLSGSIRKSGPVMRAGLSCSRYRQGYQQNSLDCKKLMPIRPIIFVIMIPHDRLIGVYTLIWLE